MPMLDLRGGSIRVDHLDFGRENFIRRASSTPVLEIVSNDVIITLPTVALTLATLTGTETLTNKTIDLASNTLVATSAQIAAAVTNETGSGLLVFATSPTLTTPVLGAATGTSLSLSATAALTFTDASAQIIPGATSLLFRDTANAATNLSITDAVAVTVRAGITITTGGLAITAGAVTGLKRNPFIDAAGSDTLTAARSGEVILAGEAGVQTYTLPAATVTGATYKFVCENAGGEILVTPVGTDTMSIQAAANGASVVTAGGTGIKNTAATNVVGDHITIVADGVSQWNCIGISGTWATQ